MSRREWLSTISLTLAGVFGIGCWVACVFVTAHFLIKYW